MVGLYRSVHDGWFVQECVMVGMYRSVCDGWFVQECT